MSTDQVFPLPRSAYKLLVQIIIEYYEINQPLEFKGIVDKSIKFGKTDFGKNNSFLTSINVVKGDRSKKGLTDLGTKLGRALKNKNEVDIRKYWREVVDRNSFLNSVISHIPPNGEILTLELKDTIQDLAFSSVSRPRTKETPTGAKAIIDILVSADYITISKGKVRLAGKEAVTEEVVLPTDKIEFSREANLDSLLLLLKRFHAVARQLHRRHDHRETLVIKDEYDVQDLLHALLKTYFDDIRPEEYVPSYAGGQSRVDFLLKKEKVIIEVKMANEKLRDRHIGEQLIIDTARYQNHPDCEVLVCFVYDPNDFVTNPAGLENDLSKKTEKIDVRVLILPNTQST